MQIIFLGVAYLNYSRSSGGDGTSDGFWGFMFIVGGLCALILGLTDWRLGLWLKDYDVRTLNIASGIIAILIGILIYYNKYSN